DEAERCGIVSGRLQPQSQRRLHEERCPVGGLDGGPGDESPDPGRVAAARPILKLVAGGAVAGDDQLLVWQPLESRMAGLVARIDHAIVLVEDRDPEVVQYAASVDQTLVI